MGPLRVYFFFISGAKKGRIEAVEADVIRIGRQHYCELQLDPYADIPASGDHARVVREGLERWALIDSGSTWGTWKNDVRVMGKVPLLTGDVITCGHDDRGRAGPRIRFYQDKDIMRCPCCEGPVYKRHFRCPTCGRKYCLQCIDFRTQTCKPCGTRPPAIRPVAPPFAPLGVPQGRLMPPGGELDGPYCNLCNDSVRVPIFTCGGCRRTYCVDHRQASGSCPICAGAGQVLEEWGRGSEPELQVPDPNPFAPGGVTPFGLPVTPTPPPPPSPFASAPPTSTGTRREPWPDTRSMQRPAQRGGFETAEGEGELSDLGALDARRPPTIPCERCQAPLAMRDFFVCGMCRGRLCSRHRAPSQPEMCDLCSSGGALPAIQPAARGPGDPGPELLSTAGDADATRRRDWRNTDYARDTTADTQAPRHLAETQAGPDGEGLPAPPADVLDLSGVQFECPYCDTPIKTPSRTCPSCKREL